MIEIRNLTKRYDNNQEPTLKNISFKIANTGLYYLVGKSGSGKSTLLQIIGGMDFNYQGKVLVDNKDLQSLNENEKADYRYHKISFVFQDFQAIEKETVFDNLLKPLSISSLSFSEKKRIINRALQRVGLSDKLKKNFNQLSGGEKKRIALVRGLIKEAPILLADEPLASLNKNIRKDITDILVEESHKRAVIVITHEEDEIPNSAEVIRLLNGEIIQESQQDNHSRSSLPVLKRKKFSLVECLREIYTNLLSKKKFLTIAIFSLVIALFSITFSFLLSGGVKTSLENTITSFMSENSLVIKNKDESYNGTSFESSNVHFLQTLEKRYSDVISDVSKFYLSSTDEIFKNEQEISLLFNNKTYRLPRLSSNSFLEALTPIELTEQQKIYGSLDLSQDDIVLGLNKEDLLGLFLLCYNSPPEELTEEKLSLLGDKLQKNIITVRTIFSRGEWQYYLDHSFRLKGFFLAENECVLQTDNLFNSYFVNEILHFDEIILEEPIPENKPWTLKYVPGLRLRLNKTGAFLNLFLHDKDCNYYVPSIFTNCNYYIEEDINTHNRIIIYKDYLPKLSISSVEKYRDSLDYPVYSIRYSSSIYSYTTSGYIAGFNKPFFFSANLEELNYIQDNYQFAEVDLGQFQGSLFEVDDKVIKADLLSALDDEGMSFKVLDREAKTFGSLPKNDNEIIISSKLAERLFTSSQKAINSNLYALTLSETRKENGRYKNIFSEGILKIVGVINDKDLAIYQDALFPLCYAFSHLELKPEEIRITEAIIDVDLKNTTSEYYLEKAQNHDLVGDFPVDEIITEIEKTLKQLSNLFLSFSILGIITSSFILFLALFLFYNKDRKALGMLLAFGYYKKEINKFYFLLVLTINLVAYTLSTIISLFTEAILKQTLEDILSTYSSSFFPYLISFLTCLTISIIVSFALTLKLKNLTPKEAFSQK